MEAYDEFDTATTELTDYHAKYNVTLEGQPLEGHSRKHDYHLVLAHRDAYEKVEKIARRFRALLDPNTEEATQSLNAGMKGLTATQEKDYDRAASIMHHV